jgi:hypothetical protein
MEISKGRHRALDGAKIHVLLSGQNGFAFKQELKKSPESSSQVMVC